jgi:Fur family transcriptional regulator, zinc uptake regulator
MNQACDHLHHHVALTCVDIEQQLTVAEALCRQSGERMTASRKRTLELVLNAGAPIKAYDVIEHFHADAAAKPPTVYRALGFLEQMGLIHRIESLNAYVACASSQVAHRAVFLLCDCCGRSEEVGLASFKDIEAAAQGKDFQISRLTLEVRGLCKTCG